MRRTVAWTLLLAMATTTAAIATTGIEGRWTLDARDRGDHARLNLSRSWNRGASNGRWSSTTDISRGELRGLPASRGFDGPVTLSLVRESGTLHLEGRLNDGRGSGRFTYERDPGFVADLERAGFHDVNDEQLIRLCIDGLGRAWIKDLRSLGLHDPTLEDLVRLYDNDVKPEFMRALVSAGYGGLGVEDIIRLRNNDVTADYVRGLGVRRGWHPSVEDVVRFRNNGLESAYVSALAPHFDAEEMVRLHNNDVSADFVREFRALGYESATADELVRLRNNDVSPAFARRALTLHGRVTTEELIKLKVNGVE